MTKKEARIWFMELRKSLTDIEYKNLNDSLLHQFTLHNSWKNKNIATFLSIEDKLELAIDPINQMLLKENNLYASVANFQDTSMEFYALNEQTIIKTSAFGIPEPQNGETIAAEKIDIVLTPLLGLDEKGYRVGYGKGFYDRFSERTHPDTLFIGVSLFEPISSIIDINEWDKKLNACITPTKYYSFE